MCTHLQEHTDFCQNQFTFIQLAAAEDKSHPFQRYSFLSLPYSTASLLFLPAKKRHGIPQLTTFALFCGLTLACCEKHRHQFYCLHLQWIHTLLFYCSSSFFSPPYVVSLSFSVLDIIGESIRKYLLVLFIFLYFLGSI